MTKQQEKKDEAYNYRLFEKIRAGLIYLSHYPFPYRARQLRREIAKCVRQVERTRKDAVKALAASRSKNPLEEILDAKIVGDCLCVTSTELKHLKIPLSKIPSLSNRATTAQADFEIDEDGAYIYWRQFDVHLGWEQLQQIVDRRVALKANQKHGEFNVRFGSAVRVLRRKANIRSDSVRGLDVQLLRRIETGKCRLTSTAIKALAAAHKMSPNEYLKLLAENVA